MDASPPQANIPILKKSFLNTSYLIYLIILLIGFILGIALDYVLPIKQYLPAQQIASPASPTPPVKLTTIDSSILPVSATLLTNPIVYQWRGSVKGKLTKKDDHSFTLVDEQNNSITITDKMPSGDIFKTMFFDKKDINKQITLQDIPLNSILLGDFFIFKNGPNTPVGSNFIKQ